MTVESFGKQSRGGGFADAARTREQISVVQTLMLDRVAQRAGDCFLAGYFVEALRPPFACNYLVGH
jgi:hypothetical protein